VQGVEGDVGYGQRGEELARFSEGLDLLLVGSRGYGPVGRLLNGSTSNYLSRHARCPLLVLPRSNARRRPAGAGEEEETPVGTAA
jgi:nucleotide-binding universal stress UspA family protein